MRMNVQFPGVLLQAKPKAFQVQLCDGRKEWLPRKGVIAATRQDDGTSQLSHWFTVHPWLAALKRIEDARPENER